MPFFSVTGRRTKGTDKDEIKKALEFGVCLSRCKLQCAAFCKRPDAVSVVLSWRQRYYKYVHGAARQTALINLIKMTWAKSKGAGLSCHLVDDFYVCRWVYEYLLTLQLIQAQIPLRVHNGCIVDMYWTKRGNRDIGKKKLPITSTYYFAVI